MIEYVYRLSMLPVRYLGVSKSGRLRVRWQHFTAGSGARSLSIKSDPDQPDRALFLEEMLGDGRERVLASPTES
jgi:hypothetical protein